MKTGAVQLACLNAETRPSKEPKHVMMGIEYQAMGATSSAKWSPCGSAKGKPLNALPSAGMGRPFQTRNVMISTLRMLTGALQSAR